MSSTGEEYLIEVSLPQQWRTHDNADWPTLAEVSSLNPVLRRAAIELGDGSLTPTLIASLTHEIDVESDGSRTVLMASLVVFTSQVEGSVTSVPATGVLRRNVPIIDDITADFLQYEAVVVDEAFEMAAVATFSTPNLPLADEMVAGFAEIARSIRFEPAHQA